MAGAYGVKTNMEAEAKVLWQGLKRCWVTGVNCIDVESDSKVLVHIVKGGACPWPVEYLVKDNQRLLAITQSQISHVYREINYAADFLANYGCSRGAIT